MARKFKKDTPVVHLKSGVRGTVVLHEGDKVTYLKEDGTNSTVKADSLETVSKYEADQAKAAKKAQKEADKKLKAAERAARPKRERQAASKDGYVRSGQLEYKPDRYIPRDEAKTASGSKVRDIGDSAADELVGKSFDEMVAIVARATGLPKTELSAKYADLNPGMQRMTLGNRLRAALRKAAEGDTAPPKKPAKPKVDAKPKPARKTAKKEPAKEATA